MLLQKSISRELATHAIKSNEQTVIKKKTKGWGSGKCITSNIQQSWVGTTRKPIQFNFYDKFVSEKHVPEYVCTCCDQLWFKCSVVKCDPNKYKACSRDIVESCFTDFTSVDDTKWICITCNSILKKAGYPAVLKLRRWVFLMSLRYWIWRH